MTLLLTANFVFGQESAQIMVVTGRIHQEYQWIFDEDDAEVLVSLHGREGEKYPAVLYPESVVYARIFLALSGHVAQVGDNATVFVNHDGVNLWTDSHRLDRDDINSGTCVIDIKPTQDEKEQSPIMVIAGHVDEAFREIFNDPETEIVISLGDVHIPGKIVDDGQTYTGIFIALDGYVAEIDDIVTVTIYKNGIALWERYRPVTQGDLERAVIVINLEQVITTADVKRRSVLVTWGSLKE